jgi:dipeptidase E
MKPTIILLSSNKFLAQNPEILGRPFKDCRIAYITTASKAKVITDLSYLERTKQIFTRLGVFFEEIDIADQTEDELRNQLSQFNIIYVEGGSSLYLLQAIKRSGFDNVLKELLQKDVLYLGASAGAMVCCPTIETSIWKHPERFKDVKETELVAMHLVPFLLFVHFTPECESIVKENAAHANYPTKLLTDGQAILVKGEQYELLGEGSEIRFLK